MLQSWTSLRYVSIPFIILFLMINVWGTPISVVILCCYYRYLINSVLDMGFCPKATSSQRNSSK
nr:hypothetical protein Itr_chr08CG11790 [Ipomoea trifida]